MKRAFFVVAAIAAALAAAPATAGEKASGRWNDGSAASVRVVSAQKAIYCHKGRCYTADRVKDGRWRIRWPGGRAAINIKDIGGGKYKVTFSTRDKNGEKDDQVQVFK
ncbi:hypothetical protein KC722_02105 [Candidatus Kaiserbacteria bacterium]|nr:hypothetical protein [Candidatus Kaiserbacteria bacterium]MCB9811540.1 hypothetical protein [Candidatus Nomurabacteria bacterium]